MKSDIVWKFVGATRRLVLDQRSCQPWLWLKAIYFSAVQMSNCDTLASINVYSPLQMARRIFVESRFIFICFISKTIPTKRRRKSENGTHCTQTHRCTQTETEKTKDKSEKRRFRDNYPTQRFVASVRWNSQLPTAGGRFLNSVVGDRQRHRTLLLYKKKGGL